MTVKGSIDMVFTEDEAATAHAGQLPLVLRAVVFQHSVFPLRHGWGGLRRSRKWCAMAASQLRP
jgi:hypothetical protein